MSLTVHNAAWPCAGPSSGRTRMRYHAASPWPESGGDEAQFLDRRPARARGLGEPVDRLRGLRRAGEQPLDARRLAVARARQRAIGFVGVEHARGRRGDDEAFLAGLGDGAREIEFAGAADEAHQPEAYMRIENTPKIASAAMVKETAWRPNSPGANTSAAAETTTASSMSAASSRAARPVRAPWRRGVVDRDVMRVDRQICAAGAEERMH